MIVQKTARELWLMTLIYLLIMQAILLPAIALWPDLNIIGQQLKPIVLMAKILKSVLFRELIGALDQYPDYYALQAFFKGGNFCGAAAAVLMGLFTRNKVAPEEEEAAEGTLGSRQRSHRINTGM